MAVIQDNGQPMIDVHTSHVDFFRSVQSVERGEKFYDMVTVAHPPQMMADIRADLHKSRRGRLVPYDN